MNSTHSDLINSASNDSRLFSELRRQVSGAGLLDTQRGYYTVKIGGTLLAWAVGWVALFAVGSSWWQLLVAVYLAECAVQLAFIFHDASHKEISRSKNLTLAIGYTVGNLLLGVSFGWWLAHHGQHHNNPNHLELDPDITRKIAVFTPDHVDRRRGWKRWIVKHQAHIYFPFTSLDTLRLRVASIEAIKNGKVKHPVLETSLLLVHAALFFGAVFWVMGIGQAIAFTALYHVLVGIHLGMSFAPNHKGMPTTDGTPSGWIERQVLTSRNIAPGPFTDLMYGGLNYQIEHHLFPTMPRNNLKRARPIVRVFLEQNDYPYTETSVRQSLRDITTALEWASEPARR